MQELPDNLLTTDKLLYLTGLDGKSQIPLMKKLAQLAQELYNKYPEFCGLVPFGSRIRGLSEEDNSDIDLFIILDFGTKGLLHPESRKRTDEIIKYLKKETNGLKGKISPIEVGIYEYKHLLTTGEYDSIYGTVFYSTLGPTLGPNNLVSVRSEAKTIPRYAREVILKKILTGLETTEQFGIARKRVGPDKTLKMTENRIRLWERRIRSLLDLKVEKKD